MTLNKKILAAAIVGGLFATAAQAQVNLNANPVVPVTLATEQNFTAGELTTSANAAFNLQFNTGYAFSIDEIRYARIECSENVAFTAINTDIITGANSLHIERPTNPPMALASPRSTRTGPVWRAMTPPMNMDRTQAMSRLALPISKSCS